MHLPTLRQLQFLTALADAGSFSRAAEACLVTQPTLSAAIKEIETLIGATLVERSGRTSRLTSAGEIAVERARRILAETEEMVSLTRGAGTPLAGNFRLGAIPTIAPFLLPDTVKHLRDEYKELKLYLREDKTVSLLAALQARTLDAAIIALPWHTLGIDTLTVGTEHFQLVFPTAHSFASKANVSPEDIQNEALLLLEEGHCMRGHTLSVCPIANADKANELAATSLHTLVQMVAGGLGVSLIPDMAVSSGITAGLGLATSPFQGQVPGRDIAIAWREGSIREAEARMIGEIVRKVMKS